MQKFVSFRVNRECREITLNPAKVLYVCHYEHGASCIHFGKECFVRVQGEVSEVVAKIEAALCEGSYPAVPAGSADELRRAN